MSEEEVVNIILEIVEDLRNNFVPNPATRYKTSTGNMAFNSLKVHVFPMYNKTEIDIWMDEKIAPYVVYTDKPWISPKWHGKKNPNEGWWDRFYETLAERIASKVSGEIKK